MTGAIGTRTTQVRFSDEYLDWRRLVTAVESDGGDPAGVVLWLSKLLEDDAWRTFRGESWPPFASFEEFVRERDHGLGMEPVDLLLLLSVRGHTEANAHWDGALFDEVREQVAELLGVAPGVRERLLAAVMAG
ncbi:Uncharacterised protein [Mycobacteroides abscessus subsp. abscessus]|uniref:hypothetical protein n=1 Tax=Mycobacteroides abscessus TaxID=36809 RepID=UPI0009287B28|nr:hypothetical protein [Mycobacteroides abscessus]MBE5513779.1 hypothetical protein [Mycobacteroides abscessus]MBN7327675.1 hypothetical protein [Mycobacteroides abscessus subsp. abscessus]SID61694.1 Uncharacterised protein [Mycobacteroides abscessus subsp. abscessus]SIE83978.1 Uncharacterised protein [Mycobacteroides abscessus subsp. abscessus]SIF72033.1 Uncharacterised protein [Mycobacteroides abscessus subsp. abscessus]